MKIIILLSFLLQIVFSGYIYSQFTGYYGTINKKPAYDGKESVVTLRDQNDDGYDDYMICEGNWRFDTLYTFYFFHGGPVIDTMPYYKFDFPFKTSTGISQMISYDVNKDGYNDLILRARKYKENPYSLTGTLLLFYGGPILDSIPDQIMEQPEGASYNWGNRMNLIKDFNGDGIDELVCFDANTRYSSSLQYGTFYIYKIANSVIDTIPFCLLEGDPVTKKRFEKLKTADVNRDGLPDLVLYGFVGTDNDYYCFNQIYLGNANWDVSECSQEIRGDTQFEIDILWQSIYFPDINLDGKADVIVHYFGEPSWHGASFWKGGYPVDTTLMMTINTSNQSMTDEVAGDFDANGDGIPDLLMKMGGLYANDTFLWLGSRNFQQYPIKKWFAQEFWEGRFSGKIGDVNGDGADDIFIGQSFENYDPGKVQIFLGDTSVHVDTTTDIQDDEIKKPESYQLLSAYPNPFNPETVIIYELPVNSKVILGIYDILGREVAKLVDKEQEAGKYEIRFNGSGLASGVYVVRYSNRPSDGLEVINSLKIELVK